VAERAETPLLLKRAKVSRSSGQWRDEDYDVCWRTAWWSAASSSSMQSGRRAAVDVCHRHNGDIKRGG